MIRLRPLRPREQRNLRHWGMELVIVVVGVLIALWAQEWAEGRAQAERQAKAMEALAREIRVTQIMASRPTIIDTCLVTQIETLKQLLSRDESDWPGIVVKGSTGFGQVMGSPILYPTNLYSVAAYERARETGAIEDLPPDKAFAYEEIFYILRALDEDNREISRIISALRPLSIARPLGSSERTEMLQHLARFDRLRFTSLIRSAVLAEEAGAVGLRIDPGKDARLIVDWQERAQLLDDYDAECIADFDWKTGKAVERQ